MGGVGVTLLGLSYFVGGFEGPAVETPLLLRVEVYSAVASERHTAPVLFLALIHRSAWKGYSTKYVPQQRRFWSKASLLALLSLRTSRGMKGGLQFSE